MIIELHHNADGTVEILIPGAGYAIPRKFAWYSDAVTVLITNYSAKYMVGTQKDPYTELWSGSAEVLNPVMYTGEYKI